MPERIDPKTRTCVFGKKGEKCGRQAAGFWMRWDKRNPVWPEALCFNHAWSLGIHKNPQSPLYK